MTYQSNKIMAEMQVRKSKKQKENFRAWLCKELEAAGYAPTVEKGFAARNVVVGDPDKAKVLLTAHYDTQAVLPIPNFITPRNLLFYLLYQIAIVLPLFIAIGVVEGVLLAFAPEAVQWWLMPLASMGICVFFIWWIMDGKANRHTANDNTSGVLTLLETALALPPEHRDRVCFVFFDNEEKGMFGSAAFSKKHKQVKKHTTVLNFDCVSDGDSIQFFPQKKLKKDEAVLQRIEAAFLPTRGKDVQVVRSFSMYPSDNANFKRGAGVCALKHKKVIGYYMDRIHTNKDTILDKANIALLRDGCLRYIAGLDG
ncbi:MAG: Zn-dependent exopeptidase M28 [Oscillospiraceae bacterium]|nr:Zn-dependent exopeptidase M28 [Oscillospiraceae bacterium]